MTAATAIRELSLSRYFDAPPERVFDAWIGSDWGRWLPPRGATCRVIAADAQVGGRFELAMVMPDGRRLTVVGTYREVHRPERLVFTWEGDFAGGTTLISVTLRPEGKGTQLSLRQEGFEQDEARTGYAQGWGGPGGSFEKLAALLQGETSRG